MEGLNFEKCEECGVMIAIAVFDMHECGEKRSEVKRFKCVSSGKYEEVSVPVVDDLILISDKAYTRREVLDMEKLMANTLQFNFSLPTPYVFMRRFLKAAQSDKKQPQNDRLSQWNLLSKMAWNPISGGSQRLCSDYYDQDRETRRLSDGRRDTGLRNWRGKEKHFLEDADWVHQR
ncbi:hypothetical protein F2Q69_00026478 [Brassica cretica]|uniref:Cyclin N-terminal domain-containing protein n=1 Tax=Brassica cretica TaxID=69181 RepID=A0A8S9RZJ8_BRACR|nr:hypothetical protein F2Q69_00026478 [Brassica cretica]